MTKENKTFISFTPELCNILYPGNPESETKYLNSLNYVKYYLLKITYYLLLLLIFFPLI